MTNVNSWLQIGLTGNKARKNMRLVRLVYDLREIWSIKWVDSVVPGGLMDSSHIYTQLHKFLVSRKSWLRQKEIPCRCGVPSYRSASVRAVSLDWRWNWKVYIETTYIMFILGDCTIRICVARAQESAFLGH